MSQFEQIVFNSWSVASCRVLTSWSCASKLARPQRGNRWAVQCRAVNEVGSRGTGQSQHCSSEFQRVAAKMRAGGRFQVQLAGIVTICRDHREVVADDGRWS